MEVRYKSTFYMIGALLYGAHPSFIYSKDGRVTIRTVPFAKWLRLSRARYKLYWEEAERLGLVEDVEFLYGYTSCRIKVPLQAAAAWPKYPD